MTDVPVPAHDHSRRARRPDGPRPAPKHYPSPMRRSQPLPPRLLVLSIALAVMLAGCAAAPAPRCDAGEQLLVSELLYFGTEKPGGAVTLEEWSMFLREVVTPKFPEGLTVWPASGQWRSGGGAVTREASYVLNLVHPETAAAESAVREIVTEYKNRFRQEAVLRVKDDVCVSF